MLLGFVLSIVSLLPLHAAAEVRTEALTPGSHDVPLGDITIHYVVAGHGPLVFVTSVGWGLGTLIYQNGFRPLESQFKMVFVDERGNGGSSMPADLFTVNIVTQADDLDRLRAYLGLDTIKLIGHSSGGTIALDYAERYPARLEKGVLLDPGVLGDRDEQDNKNIMTAWQDDPRYKTAVENVRKHFIPQTDKEATDDHFSYLALYLSRPDLYLEPLKRTFGNSQINVVTFNAIDKGNAAKGRNQPADYDKVQAKVLIMSGTVDFVCPYQTAVRMHSGIKNSTLNLYANTGHFVWIEQPQRFFREVSQFLKD